MGETEKSREEVYAKAIRAGKRTYFFDVKATKAGEYYLTITESKKRFDNAQGKFLYEKHKLFLYKEDFEKFTEGLTEVTKFITTGEKPADYDEYIENGGRVKLSPDSNEFTDISFEDLGDISEK